MAAALVLLEPFLYQEGVPVLLAMVVHNLKAIALQSQMNAEPHMT